jgi:hypothetical protein
MNVNNKCFSQKWVKLSIPSGKREVNSLGNVQVSLNVQKIAL